MADETLDVMSWLLKFFLARSRGVTVTIDTPESLLWMRRFHPTPADSMRLICFPFAGGSASYFRPLSELLAPNLDVVGIQYPGRQDRHREDVIDDIPSLVAQIADVVADSLDRPFAFFGHSMGSLVAFEAVRHLTVQGGPLPQALFVSGRRAPSVQRLEAVHQLNDADLMAEMRSLGGTDSALLNDQEIVRMILPAIRGDYRAVETYQYSPGSSVLDVPIIAMIGDQDPRVTITEARTWEHHTSRDFDLHVFPGGHFYLNHFTADVAKEINMALNHTSEDR
ncbi:thioesterase II family protein [Streptomyces sp. NPDC056749]|uniref:thioesterase II family protein n=1 Tax=Streptomyces sp. NPDC056749 TaxID=3345936 RepID=UPI0036B36224